MTKSQVLGGYLINFFFALCFLNLLLIPFAHYNLPRQLVMSELGILSCSLGVLTVLMMLQSKALPATTEFRLGGGASVVAATAAKSKTGLIAVLCFYGLIFCLLTGLIGWVVIVKSQSAFSGLGFPRAEQALAIDAFCGYIFLGSLMNILRRWLSTRLGKLNRCGSV